VTVLLWVGIGVALFAVLSWIDRPMGGVPADDEDSE